MGKSAALLTVALLVGCGGRSLPYENRSVAELRKMLDDPTPRVQAQGAVGLSLHGPAATAAVPRLIALLKSPDALVRQQAALALGKVGPEAREGVSGLLEALDDREWAVRRQAALALGEVGAKVAIPGLRKRSKDENALVRKAAAQALEKLK